MTTGIIIIISALFQIYFLIILGRNQRKYTQLRKHGVQTQGEITDYEIQSTGKGQKIYFPIIKFRTFLGQEIHRKASYGLDARKYIEKGIPVEIIYSENDPDRFMLASHNPPSVFIFTLLSFIASTTLLAYVLTIKNPNWLKDFLNSF